MNNESNKARFRKVLVIDEDETDIYISKRIIKTSLFSDEVISTSSVMEAMDYLRQNTAAELFPELIFLGLNLTSINGADFMKQYSEFAEKERKNSRIVLMMNVIGMGKMDVTKIKTHPQIKFVVEKPLTKEALLSIS
jgi:two-component SAPR family response regulator